MEKYTLDGDELMKNGQMTICPKTPPFLAPDNSTIHKVNIRVAMSRAPCNKSCPFFQITEIKDKKSACPNDFIKVIVLHCMEKPRIIRYENTN